MLPFCMDFTRNPPEKFISLWCVRKHGLTICTYEQCDPAKLRSSDAISILYVFLMRIVTVNQVNPWDRCQNFHDARMFAGNIFLAEAYLVEVSHRVRPIFWIIEQPMSSQMFDMPTMRSCAALWGLFMVTTWMGCYGHLLQKNTKLLCNLPGSKACFINNYCIIFWFFCFILHPFRTVASMMKLTLASEL